MGIFDLPPKEKRKPSNLFFLKGNAEFSDWVSEPDYYICYRVGRDFRIAAIAFGLTIFAICLLYRYAGIFPGLMDYPHQDNLVGTYLHLINSFSENFPQKMNYPEQKDFLGLYLYLINFTGPMFLLVLIYYGLWFKKNISFSEYNILRQDRGGGGECQDSQLVWAIIFTSLCLLLSLIPSKIASFFYMYIHQGSYDKYFDTTGLVLFVSLTISFIHPLCVQVLFKHSLIITYILRNNFKKGSGHD